MVNTAGLLRSLPIVLDLRGSSSLLSSLTVVNTDLTGLLRGINDLLRDVEGLSHVESMQLVLGNVSLRLAVAGLDIVST